MAKVNPDKITEKDALCVLSVVSRGLVNGVGQPIPGKMCVEAAVAYAFGEHHHDEPDCVAAELAEEKIALNDADGWSSDKARAKGLRAVAIAQLGSAGRFDYDDYRGSMEEQARAFLLPLLRRHALNWAARQMAWAKKADLDALESRGQAEDWAPFNTGELDSGVGGIHETFHSLLSDDMTGDEINSAIADMMVKALREQKIPGTKYLYLLKSKKKMTAKQIEQHRKLRQTQTH